MPEKNSIYHNQNEENLFKRSLNPSYLLLPGLLNTKEENVGV